MILLFAAGKYEWKDTCNDVAIMNRNYLADTQCTVRCLQSHTIPRTLAFEIS